MKKIYRTVDPLLPVEHPVIGAKYHLAWARKHGMVWTLVRIEGDSAVLQTPVTKKWLRAKLVDLRHTRNEQTRIEREKLAVKH